MNNKELSRDQKANLYYNAIQELDITELPAVSRQEEIPLVYLKSFAYPSIQLSDDIEDYKWDIKRYLKLLEFSRTMANVFGSDHIKSWDLLNRNH